MAKRLSLDDKLAAVRLLRDRDPSPELTAELKTAIDDRSNLIVAAAAAIAGDQGLVELAPTLASALDRFLVDPLKTDKLCRAKLAVIQALDKLEHGAPDVFLKAARHVQLEPVWGGSEDTAAPLRAAALLALARIDVDGLLTLLVDALVDPQKDVRIAAAQALGYHGSESAGLILRLKARLGDREPEVFSECLCGLLACARRRTCRWSRDTSTWTTSLFARQPSSPWGGRACPKLSGCSVLSGIVSHLSYCGRLFSLPWSCSAFPRRPNSWSSWSPPVPRPPRSPPYPHSRSTRTIQGSASGSRR